MSKTHSLPNKDTLIGLGVVSALVILVVVSLIINIPSLLAAYGMTASDPGSAPIDTATVRQAIELLGPQQ